MRVLVACEYSGVVRNAFIAMGHDAWSCDLLPTELGPEFHYQCDALDVLHLGWDLMIAHPPCTYLAVSGARWFRGRLELQDQAIRFALALWNAPINKIALENPIGVLSRYIGKASQIIHPWMFGHEETKATCLWLKSLPQLDSTEIVAGHNHRVHMEPPSVDRWKNRSRTLHGIAQAMADQWGD